MRNLTFFFKAILIFKLAFISGMASAFKDSIIAVVENEVITSNELLETGKKNTSSSDVKQILDNEIDKKIILLEIKKRNIEPSKEVINLALNDLAKINGLSLNALINLPNFDFTLKELRFNFSREILKKEIIQSANIEIQDSEVLASLSENPKKIYDDRVLVNQLKLKSLTIDPEKEANSEEIESYLLDVVQKFKTQKTSINDLNTLISSESKYINQTLWIARQDVPSQFYEFLDKIPVGEISEPILLDGVWTLIFVKDKFKKDITLSIVKSNIKKLKEAAFFNNWLKESRENYYIKIFNKKFDAKS